MIDISASIFAPLYDLDDDDFGNNEPSCKVASPWSTKKLSSLNPQAKRVEEGGIRNYDDGRDGRSSRTRTPKITSATLVRRYTPPRRVGREIQHLPKLDNKHIMLVPSIINIFQDLLLVQMA